MALVGGGGKGIIESRRENTLVFFLVGNPPGRVLYVCTCIYMHVPSLRDASLGDQKKL